METHPKIHDKLQTMVKNKKIPHIVFHGPSGGGKRSLLGSFIQAIYNNNNEKIKQYVMYVNCAHSKGIRYIREQLKFFAKTNIQNKKGFFFKSIVLFNAEKLTMDAQSALRRCIERFSHTTRFFIVVEDKNKLLKPILSRFCNIYIPLPTINNVKCNLHLAQEEKNSKDKRYIWLKKQLNKKGNFTSIIKCHNLAIKLYERGYHIFDLINFIEKDSTLPNKYFYLVYFDRIRIEFRNEKLLMFHILFIIFMRPNLSLENIELM